MALWFIEVILFYDTSAPITRIQATVAYEQKQLIFHCRDVDRGSCGSFCSLFGNWINSIDLCTIDCLVVNSLPLLSGQNSTMTPLEFPPTSLFHCRMQDSRLITMLTFPCRSSVATVLPTAFLFRTTGTKSPSEYATIVLCFT